MNKKNWKNVTPAHEKLWIWQKANQLYLKICELSKTLPADERFKLKDQIVLLSEL